MYYYTGSVINKNIYKGETGLPVLKRNAMANKTKTLSVIFSVVAGVLIAAIVVGMIVVIVGMSSRGGTRYGDIKYSRPDFDELDEAFDDAISAAEHGSRLSAVDSMNNATELFSELVFCVSYASIEYQKDYTDSYWRNEYTELYSQYNKSYLDYYTMLNTALDRSDSGSIFSGWSSEEMRSIRDEYAALTGTGDYVENQNEILEITTEYNDLGTGNTNVFASEDTAREFATEAGDLLIRLVRTYNEMYPEGYVDQAYASYGREYTAVDAAEMRGYVKDYLGEYIGKLYDDLGDTGIYLYNRTRLDDDLTQSNAVAGLLADVGSREATRSVDPDMEGYLAEANDYMRRYDLYYRSTNPNGNTGAYTTYLAKYEMPYLFQYVSGSLTDTSTFVHEFGHFASFYLNGAAGGADLDVAEIQSQALEMMFIGRYDELYAGYTVSNGSETVTGSEIAEIAEKGDIMNQLIFSIVMGCVFDELQYDMYTNTDSYSSGADVTEKFTEILADYGIDEELALRMSNDLGYDYNYFEYWWAAVSHTFEQPFYYISYAMSAIPAFTIYVDSTSDFISAATEYNYIQRYGDGSYGFEELLDNAGVSSPFDARTYSELASYLDTLV